MKPRLFVLVAFVLFEAVVTAAHGQAILVKDINKNNGVAAIPFFAPFANTVNNELIIYCNSKTGYDVHELWRTDGTENGTRLSIDLGPASYYHGTTNGYAYFYQFNFSRLVRTDGISTPELVKDFAGQITGFIFFSTPYTFSLGERHVFMMITNEQGPISLGGELWVTDGTSEGTHVLKDINPGTASSVGIMSNSSRGIKVNDTLAIFPAENPSLGVELWRTNGTSEGTQLVKDINPGSNASYPSQFAELNGVVYFRADDGTHGQELWKSDGTTQGTAMVTDLFGGSGSSKPQSMRRVGNHIFFAAFDETHGWALWKTDGTENGTVMVKDIHPSTADSFAPSQFTAAGTSLYFSANDGIHGEELWSSDGTAEGTEMIEIASGNSGSSPVLITYFGIDKLIYFSTNNELWRYSAEVEVAERVATENPRVLRLHNGDIYAVMASAQVGTELFRIPIKKFDQNLIFDPVNDQVEGAPTFTLNARSNTNTSIAFLSNSDNVSISGNLVTVHKPGSVTITAYQASNQSLNDATQTRTFCVRPSKPDITQLISESGRPTLSSNKEQGNTWLWNGSAVSNEKDMTITKAGTYTLTVSVENCVSEAATIDIPKVDQVISFPLEDKPLETGSFTLDATTNSGLPITYDVNNDVLSITGSIATITKAGTVTITAKQAGDELFNSSEFSKTICITPSKPTISVSTVSGVPQLSSSSADGNSWLLNGSPLSTTGSSLVVSSAGIYNVKVTIDECPSSWSENITIEKLSPSITFELADQPFESGTFTLAGLASSGKNVSFTTTSSKVVLAGKVVTMKEPGKVSITASTPSDALYNSAEAERTICILPAKPTISVTDPFAGGQTITSSASTGNQWYLNEKVITSAVENDLKVSASGNYSVQVSIETCISPMSEPISMVVTGLIAESLASIFPNPAEKYVTIRVAGSEMIRGYQVISSSGVVVKSESVNQTECVIDIEHFPPGIYAIAIQTERTSTMRKFIRK